MSEDLKVHVSRSSDRDDYCTPFALYQQLDSVFKFSHDMAATRDNRLTIRYFSDSLIISDWNRIGSLWCNPPFSNKEEFLKRGVEARDTNIVTVFIVPNNARSTEWWRTYALQADQIINLTPRVNYFLDGKEARGVAFDSCLLVYYPRIPGVDYGLPRELYWKWK